MASSDRSLDVIAFVSEHFRDILRKRLSELAGLALITLAASGDSFVVASAAKSSFGIESARAECCSLRIIR